MIDYALEILSHQEIPIRITLSVHWLFLWDLCCLLICSDMDKRDTEDIRIIKYITRSWVPRKIVRQLETMKGNHWIKVFAMGCFAKPCLACFVVVANLSASARSPMKNCTTKHASSKQSWYKWWRSAFVQGLYYKNCRIFYSKFFVKCWYSLP